jgi:hypothetical protein
VRCPACAQPCERLGYKIPIPPKSRKKAWEELFTGFYNYRREELARARRLRVRRIHELEQQVARLEALPVVRGRTRTLSLLKRRLVAVRAWAT